MTGYLHPCYANSLSEYGAPLELPSCGGWLLRRPIPSTTLYDGMGCYPLFSCRDWSKLEAEVNTLGGTVLSIALVVDPFASVTIEGLKRCFDFVNPFKENFTIDLHKRDEEHISRHHRYYARKALRLMKVERVEAPRSRLDEWCALYEKLIERHKLRGIKAFSRESFSRQLEVPGLTMFIARIGEEIIGSQLWYLQGDVAYSHLTAVSDVGYSSRATYAIYSTAIETFKTEFQESVRWLDLGAGAGSSSATTDGLAEFKSGWANGSRTKYFVGKVFDREAYDYVVRTKNIAATNYFPAYRDGEF
jgi:hypothetical protein